MDKIYHELLAIGYDLLKDSCGAQQVIVLQTAKGNTYSGISIGENMSDRTPEDALLKTVQDADDTHVLHLVCVWYTKQIDLPSMRFRKALLEMDSRNGETQILVLTGAGRKAKPLSCFF